MLGYERVIDNKERLTYTRTADNVKLDLLRTLGGRWGVKIITPPKCGMTEKV